MTQITQIRGASRRAAPRQGISLRHRKPKLHAEVLRAVPPGYRELSIPAANRGPLTAKSKTLRFDLTYNDRPATIAVTVNDKGRPVHAYVGGALATAVTGRILLAKPASLAGPARQASWRPQPDNPPAAVKTFHENLEETPCAASAVAKSVLESLGFPW